MDTTRGARRGMLIAATWLIGIGVLFLVKQAGDLSWGEAWPLWIILIGVASFVSATLDGRFRVTSIWAFTWPIVWAGVGVVLFLSTTGNLGPSAGDVIAQWWPWALVVLGIWFVVGSIAPVGRRLTETLDLALGEAPDASVRIGFGGGNLTTHAAAGGRLIDGSFAGGVTCRQAGPNRLDLTQDTTYGLPWIDRRSEWDVGLTAEVPLDLRIDAGASRALLDLGVLRVRSLELHTGASDTRVLLPRAAGATAVRAEAGAASLTFEVPAGVAARIRSRMAIGSTQVDLARFPRTVDGYESPDYATAQNRVDIDVQGGVGSVRVTGGA
jgi:hypothetical protein